MIEKTSFNLAFGAEVVIPIEIGLLSMRLEHYDEQKNPNQLRTSLDLFEETKEAQKEAEKERKLRHCWKKQGFSSNHLAFLVLPQT